MVLIDADWDDYQNLHDRMGQQGFSKTITSSDGIVYDLPDAEYNIVGALTKSDVMERAKNAARGTGKKFQVLVTEAVSRSWWNLDKA